METKETDIENTTINQYNFDSFMPQPVELTQCENEEVKNFVEKIRDARKIIINSLEDSYLDDYEKNKVIKSLDKLYFRRKEKIDIINGNFEAAFFKNDLNFPYPDGTYHNSIVVSGFNINFLHLLHEMYHASSAVFSEYVGLKEDNFNHKPYEEAVKNRGINEAITCYFVNKYQHSKQNQYEMITRIATELFKNLNQKRLFTMYVRGNCKAIKEMILKEFGESNRQSLDDLFSHFDFMHSQLLTRDCYAINLYKHAKCVTGVEMGAVQRFAKIYTERAFAKGETDINKIYCNIVNDLPLDETIGYSLSLVKERELRLEKYNPKYLENQKPEDYEGAQLVKDDLKNELRESIKSMAVQKRINYKDSAVCSIDGLEK